MATCPRHFECDAADEMVGIFEALGFGCPEVSVTGIPGIITVVAGEDPVGVVKRIAAMIEDAPWSVRYLQRIIPISRTVPAEICHIVGAVAEIKDAIREGQTYRITVEKRHSGLSGTEIISEVAGTIPNRVCLEEPDMVVLVEIIGAKAGVSILRPDDVLSVERKKRSLSEQD